jgi:hypothetical protein
MGIMKNKTSAIIVFGLLILLELQITAGPGYSAEPGERAGHSEEEETTGPLVTDTTIPQEKGTFSIFIPLSLAKRGGDFNSHWGRQDSTEDFASLQASAQVYYGLADRTEIYLVLTYQHDWAWNAVRAGPNGETSADTGGLGDMSFSFKHLMSAETSVLPAVSALFSVGFPTGRTGVSPSALGTDSIGGGAYTFTGGLNAYKRLPRLKLYGNFWYTVSTAAKIGGQYTHPPDTITVNLAAEYPIARRWILLSEVLSTWNTDRLIGQRVDQPLQDLLSFLPAVEFISGGPWNFALGVQVDLLGRNRSYNYTPTIGFFHEF